MIFLSAACVPGFHFSCLFFLSASNVVSIPASESPNLFPLLRPWTICGWLWQIKPTRYMAITFTGWHGGKEGNRRGKVWERERKTDGDTYRWVMGHIEHSLVFLKQVQHENMVHIKTNFLNVTIAKNKSPQLKCTEISVEERRQIGLKKQQSLMENEHFSMHHMSEKDNFQNHYNHSVFTVLKAQRCHHISVRKNIFSSYDVCKMISVNKPQF